MIDRIRSHPFIAGFLAFFLAVTVFSLRQAGADHQSL